MEFRTYDGKIIELTIKNILSSPLYPFYFYELPTYHGAVLVGHQIKPSDLVLGKPSIGLHAPELGPYPVEVVLQRE